MLRATEDLLSDRIRELRAMLAVCVHRLGGRVVLNPDDEDRGDNLDLFIHANQPHYVELTTKRKD